MLCRIGSYRNISFPSPSKTSAKGVKRPRMASMASGVCERFSEGIVTPYSRPAGRPETNCLENGRFRTVFCEQNCRMITAQRIGDLRTFFLDEITESQKSVCKSPILGRVIVRQNCHFGHLLPSYFKAENR